MTPPDDPRAALAFLVVRLRAAPDTERAGVVARLLPLLADTGVPLAVRLAAAGRAIDAVPESPRTVREVVRAITAGLSPVRALHRMRHLQHLTEKTTDLDALVEARERKVKIGCPRCPARLTRAELAKHLWTEHKLQLVEGEARTRAELVSAVRREYADRADPALFDLAAEVGGERAIRAWAAATASEDEAGPVCTAARARGASACPACFADVVPPVPELPPPLAVANGRVAGEGLVASASTESPRVSATLAAALTLVLFTLLVHVAVGFVLGIVVYFATLVWRTPRAPADERAIDAAWRKLAPRLADRRDAARYLTRLCVTSVGRGDLLERANALQAVIARARANPAEVQLLAAALALQMADAGRFGRDHIAGIADLVALAFQGQHGPAFAEHALAVYALVEQDAGARGRLRVLLLAAAFAAGLGPRDLLELWSAAPHVADAMRVPPHHLALLYGVWVHRNARPWARVGDAQTVFDVAATSPATTAKLLAAVPGVLLVRDAGPNVTADLGPVLITTVGVSVGGVVSPDPVAVVRLEDDGRELIFAKHRLRLSRAVAVEFAIELKGWLRFRAEVLAAYPAVYLPADPRPASRLLGPFVATCPECGTACVPVAGKIASRQ